MFVRFRLSPVKFGPRQSSKHGILSSLIVFISEFGVKNGLMAYRNFNSLVSEMAKYKPVMRKPAVKPEADDKKTWPFVL